MADPRTDTIAAVATPPGTGALSIVRVSGPRAKDVLDGVFAPSGAASFEEGLTRHGVVRGGVAGDVDDGVAGAVDDGVAWWRRGPHTFTGEDVAEFTGHGGALVTARVLEAFLAAGARLAEPGEFTRRAFLNGRMDLARAEAVADVIAAATDDALRVARGQLAGGLSAEITRMRDEVLDALAHVEASVDFPDEDLHPDGNEAIAARFDAVARACARLAETFRRGRLFREGARVVLCGRPNVGKSSLLNALAGRNRAIVTDEPGTTRDVIEEAIDLGGLPVVLTDTAGIRETSGAAEAEGVRRSRDAAALADLVLVVFDASQGFGEEDRRLARDLGGRPAIVVANKADLLADRAAALPPARAPAPSREPLERAAGEALRVSARTGAGLDELAGEITARLLGGERAPEAVVVTRARHREALESARVRLLDAAAAARGRASPDLVASDARRGLDALGEIVGVVTTEDLLGRIFERFCVGK